MSETTNRPTVAQWKKAAFHDVVLPSGFKVKIRIPDLPSMIETGQLPQALLDVAIKVAKGEQSEATPEMASKEAEFKNLVCLAAVVEPKISEADLAPAGIPAEDKDMIAEFATRQREFDAEGNHISGLHLSAQFRRFRGLTDLYEDVADLQGGGEVVA